VYLGVHVSISGKIYDAVERARKLGCSAMQIFSRNPRQWRGLVLDEADAREFRRRRRAADRRGSASRSASPGMACGPRPVTTRASRPSRSWQRLGASWWR